MEKIIRLEDLAVYPGLERIRRSSVRQRVDDAVALLPPRLGALIRLRFGFETHEHTQRELGGKFGVTGSWISVLEHKAYRMLIREPGIREVMRDALELHIQRWKR
jgi:DNA-directed RNA polymerase sigma subunit (sigma70/sigma32)